MREPAGWRRAAAVGLFCAAPGIGCASEKADPGLVFSRDVRATYSQARACRSPGEHSGLSAFSVWVSRDAETAFAALWRTPPGISRMPEGAVVVKEIYSGRSCDPAKVERWVAMRKEAGFDPAHADWNWQEVTADGQVTASGAVTACIGCHRGGDEATCVGYGEQHGRDYTCTVPDAPPDAGLP